MLGGFTTVDIKDYETPTGAFAIGWDAEYKFAQGDQTSGFTAREAWITCDASRSNALFGASTTNQPKSFRAYALIRYEWRIRQYVRIEAVCTVVEAPYSLEFFEASMLII